MDESNHRTYWEYWGDVGIVEKKIETTIKGLGLLNIVFCLETQHVGHSRGARAALCK